MVLHFSGTAGPITQVTGTLVCSAGTDQESTFDTEPVALSPAGDAKFTGRLEDGPIACENPPFLIRIFLPAVAQGRWIATGRNALFATLN